MLLSIIFILSSFNFINTLAQCTDPSNEGLIPSCPYEYIICPGESVNMGAGLFGAPPNGTDGPPQTTSSISPSTGSNCNSNCTYFALSPLTTTSYTLTWTSYNGSGLGYFDIIVEDCGESTDAGVSAIVSPGIPLNEGNQLVQVKIENFGPGTLWNTQINWSVNGVNQSPVTYDEFPIPEGVFKYVELGQFFFESNTSYEIEAWTSNPNGLSDSNPGNDSQTRIYESFDLNYNLALTTFLQPVNPISSGTNEIEVRFRNDGNAIINNFTANWSVNGILQSPYTVNDANLAQYNSIDLVIGNANLDAATDYEIEVWVDFPNDVDANNNSITFNYNVADIPIYTAYAVSYICQGDSTNIVYYAPPEYNCGLVGPGPTSNIVISPNYNIADPSGSTYTQVWPEETTYYTMTGSETVTQPCPTGPGPIGPSGPMVPFSAGYYIVVDDCANFQNSDLAVISYEVYNNWVLGSNYLSFEIENTGQDNVYSYDYGWSINGVTQTTSNYDGYPLIPGNTHTKSNLSVQVELDIAYEIKFWINNPNGIEDSNPSNDTLTVNFDPLNNNNGLSGTFIIGGSGADYQGINEAVEDLVVNGILGDVTFNLTPGTYLNQNVDVTNFPGNSCENKIIFQSITGNAADVILEKNTAGCYFRFDGVDGLEYKNLTFKTGRCAISLEGSECIKIENCIFLPYEGTTSSEIIIYMLKCNDAVLNNNQFIDGGSNMVSFRECANLDFTNNLLDNSGWGALIATVCEIDIIGNEIKNCKGAIRLSLCKGNVKNNTILVNDYDNLTGNNYFRGVGIDIENAFTSQILYNAVLELFGSTDLYIEIENNFITASRTAFRLTNINGKFNNNNCLTTTGAETDSRVIELIVNDYYDYPTTLQIRNNNIASYSDPIMVDLQVDLLDFPEGVNWDIDYNNYYQTAGQFADDYYYESDQIGLIIDLLGLNDNSVQIGPDYISEEDLHINNPALYNIGDPQQSGLADYDGEIRDSSPSIGADQVDAAGPVADCSNNSGVIFFDNCSPGELFFFIQSGTQILDPYYAEGIDFDHYDGQIINFDYELADFGTPCPNAQNAVIITCIEEAETGGPYGLEPGTYDYSACVGDVLEIDISLVPYPGQASNPCDGTGNLGGDLQNIVGDADSDGILSLNIFNGPGTVYYTINTAGPDNPTPCQATWTFNIVLDDNCGGNTNDQIFEDYSWLNTVIDPNNCQGNSVEIYDFGAYQYLYIIGGPNDGSLYLSDGSFYCSDFGSFSCTSAYGLSNPDEVWTCGDNPTEPCSSPVTDYEALVNSIPDIAAITAGYGSINNIQVREILLNGQYIYDISHCVGPAIGYFSWVDCNGLTIPNPGPTNSGPIVYSVCEDPTNNPQIFTDYTWLSNVVDPNNCEGTNVTVYQSGNFQYLFIETNEESVLYLGDGTFYCSDGNNFSCVTAYGLNEVVSTWSCGDNPPTTNPQIFTDYTWLGNVVDPNNCEGTNITVYQSGNFQYLFIETNEESVLYLGDGTFYCTDGNNFSCITAYGLTQVVSTWSCGDNPPTTNPPIFTDFSWLSDVVDPNDCQGTSITVYQSGNFQYLFIESNDGAVLYLEDGTFYCTDGSNFSCVNAYGLTQVVSTWSCGDNPPVEDCSSPVSNLQAFLDGLDWNALGEIDPSIGPSIVAVTEIFVLGEYSYQLVSCSPSQLPTAGTPIVVDCQGEITCTGSTCLVIAEAQNAQIEILQSCGTPSIVETYPWLAEVLSGSNCSGQAVTLYQSGSTNFIFVDLAEGGELYLSDGTYYCGDYAAFSCIDAYGLSNGEILWSCTDDLPFTPNDGNNNGSIEETGDDPSNRIGLNEESQIENVAEIKMNVYPNPSSGYFNIEMTGNLDMDAEINIYNIQGKLADSFRLETNNSNQSIDVNHLESGIYFIELNSNFKTTIERLIIAR